MGRWHSTPWKRSVRAAFRDHRRLRPACPASTWASLCFPARGAAPATLVIGGGYGSLIERAAGLDVHQGSVVACVILSAAGRQPSKEVRSFGTMRQDLAALREWLLEKGVTHVGMEGTGIYWQPVHAALEGDFTVIVGNASHMRNVPGRKTDVKDAEWTADLVRHGLVRASFLPPAIRVLRELVRHRRALVGAMAPGAAGCRVGTTEPHATNGFFFVHGFFTCKTS